MDKRAKKAIGKNRVKILSLDYFDLTGPLLAADILPVKKHKDIKTEAPANKARIDLLLEWIDEGAPGEAFQPFLQGIRNCQENMLAKKIKKEAADGGMIMPKFKPMMGANVKSMHKPPPTAFPSSSSYLPGLPIFPPGSSFPKIKSPTKPKTMAKKPKEEFKPLEVSGLGTLTLPFNGLASLLPPPVVGLNTSQSRKRKSGGATDKPKTPKGPGQNGAQKAGGSGTPKVGGTPKLGDDTKVVTKSAPTPKMEPTTTKKAPQGAKIKLPRVTRKSSTDKGDAGKKAKGPAGGATKKKPEAAAASGSGGAAPKSPKAIGKAKLMSFKEAETKQADNRQKFRFKNNDAVVKIVHFKDKTDISYLGCPHEDNSKMCEKKVELKSKEFVCDSRHKSPNCKQIPRLYITCSDGTADMQLTLLKKDVESFCGIQAADLGTISINEIKDALDTTVGKKYAVEVHCEKAKKAAKKSGIPKWNNLASISSSSSTDEASPAKKKRKN